MRKLILPTLQTFVIGALVLGLLLFIPAGTLAYWQAWVFIVVFMVSVNIVGLYLSLKDPALLERRKKFGPAAEQNPVQKVIITLAVLSITALFIFCGLAQRFGWSPVPAYVALLGDVLVAAGLMENVWVFSENSFGGSTVEIRAEQKVISSGPYAAVRHPMYVGVLIMMIGVPLALNAWWGLAILLVVVPALVLRILDEEKSLRTDLPGYGDYAQKVRYRLVPYLW